MAKRKTPSSPSWAPTEWEDPALAQTQAAPVSDGAPAVGSASPAGADPLVGQILGDKYMIDALVGEGGMGRVYLAQQLSTARRVAVKMLSARFGGTPARGVRARFLAEVLTTSALNHPNIVTIYDAGETEDGTPYLVMEYLQGRDLADVLDSKEPLSEARVLSIMLQLADALSAVHEKGIVHRDLKPENIFLVCGSGDVEVVKVMDFGVAKADAELCGARNLTLGGEALGTPRYMSPEQARGELVDCRSDVYAAGLILYEMLSRGHLPHDRVLGDNPTPTRYMSVRAYAVKPTSIREYCPDLTPALARAVMHAIENDAERRTPTMAAFARELRAAMEGESVTRHPSSGRSQAVFRTGVAIAALLAVGVGVIMARSGDESGTATVPAVVEPVNPVTTLPTKVQSDKPAEPTPSPVVVPQVEPSAPTPRVIVVAPPRAKPPASAPPRSTPKRREERREREREEERAVRVAALRKEAQDVRLLLRRNPRNSALRQRLNAACRGLKDLGDDLPECR